MVFLLMMLSCAKWLRLNRLCPTFGIWSVVLLEVHTYPDTPNLLRKVCKRILTIRTIGYVPYLQQFFIII
jgi:hypothetical protein